MREFRGGGGTENIGLGPPLPANTIIIPRIRALQCVNLFHYRTIMLFIDFLFYLAIKIFYSTNKLKTLVDNRGIKNLATFEKER